MGRLRERKRPNQQLAASTRHRSRARETKHFTVCCENSLDGHKMSLRCLSLHLVSLLPAFRLTLQVVDQQRAHKQADWLLTGLSLLYSHARERERESSFSPNLIVTFLISRKGMKKTGRSKRHSQSILLSTVQHILLIFYY